MSRNDIKMVRTEELKRELEQRGCDTSSVVPARKTWSVGFSKELWQYFDGIEADTREQAIAIAQRKITESGWSDYGNGHSVCDCNEE